MTTEADLRAGIPALSAGGCAVITGGASGIGLAAAKKYAELGINVVIADLNEDNLKKAAGQITGAKVVTFALDVAKPEDLIRLKDRAYSEFGAVSILMNNAGANLNPGSAWKEPDKWRRLLDINLFGMINGVQAFLPDMVAAKKPGLVINTGSKQGITTPPGNAAYNVSKAGVKALTEALAYELRNTPDCAISAHLLIPGFTFTGMTAPRPEKPPAAWSPEQVIDFMLDSLVRGDFYVLCPDNDVARPVDEKRMRWAMGDIIENRPALSRWHPDYKDAFDAFMRG
jgi:NAD(P)-dependent dehydrogenase (short-subunit alcohol dehydrogenase family)